MRKFATVCFLIGLFMSNSSHAASRESQWKQVNDAIAKGLPRTAITNLEPIIRGALRDRAYAEAVKAIAQKVALEGNIQGNKPEEKIVRLEAEIAKAPPETVPVLDTILAHWYWQYFQQNRRRFLRRTGEGFHHLGSAAALCGNRSPVRESFERRKNPQGDPHCRLG